MKQLIVIMAFFFALYMDAAAQASDYKVVFDMSTRDTISQQALVRELQLIRQENPNAELEVVVYGQGLNMILNNSRSADAIKNILADNKTSFRVCAFTLKRNKVDVSQLVPGVAVVADGIYEIISKQKQGWGYIKVAH